MTLHAMQRAQERYGERYDNDDLLAINAAINRGDAVLRAIRDGVHIYVLTYRGRIISPVVSPETRAILTFYEPHAPLAEPIRNRRRPKYYGPSRKAREYRRAARRQAAMEDAE